MNTPLHTKLRSIEGIRGVACLMVFLSHLSSTFAPSMHTGSASQTKTPIDMLLHNSPFAFIYSGAAAVGIFFVLSGFIIGYALLEKGDLFTNASSMAVKRYFRLLPVALFSVILAFLIFRFAHVNVSALSDWAINYDIKSPSLISAIYSGSVNAFFSGSSEYNWSLWTMKIEFFGTLLICLLSVISAHTEYKKIIIIPFILIPFLMNLKAGDAIYYASFCSGLLIYFMKSKLKLTMGIISFLIGLYLCGFHTTSISYHWLNSILSISLGGNKIDNYLLINNIGGFLVVLSVLKCAFLDKILSGDLFIKMGALSFSVYAIHQPLMHLMCPLIFNDMILRGLTYAKSSLIASLLTLTAVYMLAIPVHKYVDSFSVKLSNRLKDVIIRKPDSL
jgi:peptidoglycan/LPS O-acetylase OafA/YrhL